MRDEEEQDPRRPGEPSKSAEAALIQHAVSIVDRLVVLLVAAILLMLVGPLSLHHAARQHPVSERAHPAHSSPGMSSGRRTV